MTIDKDPIVPIREVLPVSGLSRHELASKVSGVLLDAIPIGRSLDPRERYLVQEGLFQASELMLSDQAPMLGQDRQLPGNAAEGSVGEAAVMSEFVIRICRERCGGIDG